MHNRAFTLIELVVVIAILAIATGIVVLNLIDLTPKYHLRSAARYLASEIEYVMDESVSSCRVLYLGYDLDEGSYWIIIPPTITDDGTHVPAEELPPTPLPARIKIKELKLPGGAVYSGGRHAVEFNPLRTEGTHIVVLENEEEKLISVKANAYSGIISFFAEDVDFREYYEEGE